MKNIPWLFFLILLYLGLSPLTVNAQTAQLQKGFSLNNPVPDKMFVTNAADSNQSHFAIKINPLLFFTERFQVQFDIPVFKSGAAVFQIGYRNSDILPTLFDDDRQYVEFINGSTGDTGRVRYSCKGFQIAIGYKQLIGSSWFLEALFFYKQYDYIFASSGHWWSEDYFLTWGTSDPESKDSFEKVVKGATFLVGKTISNKHFSVDFYGGVGYRFKKRIIAADNGWGSTGYMSLTRNTVQEKQTISFHLGINIGYSILNSSSK